MILFALQLLSSAPAPTLAAIRYTVAAATRAVSAAGSSRTVLVVAETRVREVVA